MDIKEIQKIYDHETDMSWNNNSHLSFENGVKSNHSAVVKPFNPFSKFVSIMVV